MSVGIMIERLYNVKVILFSLQSLQFLLLVLVEFHVVIVVDCDSGDDGGRGGCGNDSGPEFITTNK